MSTLRDRIRVIVGEAVIQSSLSLADALLQKITTSDSIDKSTEEVDQATDEIMSLIYGQAPALDGEVL